MWQKIIGQRSEDAGPHKLNFSSFSFAASLLVICGAVALSGCSGSKKHAAFKGTGSPYYKGSGDTPRGGGVWKVGTPYKIAGKKYYPKENTNYDNTGIASWYGPKFHRRKTANGEWFNMHDLTAAHPTLPMPIFAKVTNLENGRNIVVRINDRGPYAHKREIDLSKASAQALGVIARGTARVRVQYLGKAPLDGRLFADMPKKEQNMLLAKINGHHQHYAENTNKEQEPVKDQKEFASDNTTPDNGQYYTAAKDEKIYVQAASFSSEARAADAKMRLSDQSASSAQNLLIAKADIGGRTWYRLRLGPFKTASEAQSALEQLHTAGHNRAMIVSD